MATKSTTSIAPSISTRIASGKLKVTFTAPANNGAAITSDSVGFLNLDVLGYILMAAGVIGLAATIVLRQRRRVRVLKNGKTVEEETTTDV